MRAAARVTARSLISALKAFKRLRSTARISIARMDIIRSIDLIDDVGVAISAGRSRSTDKLSRRTPNEREPRLSCPRLLHLRGDRLGLGVVIDVGMIASVLAHS